MEMPLIALAFMGMLVGARAWAPNPPNAPPPGIPPHPFVDALDSCNCNCNAFPDGRDDYCRWQTVFKAVNGNGRSPQSDYLTPGGLNQDVARAQDVTDTLVYRNGQILDFWNKLIIPEVKIEVFKEGIRKAWFLFNALGSKFDSWMTQDRLIASSHYGIKSDNLPLFSIKATPDTSFLIQTNYVACNTDCGYLGVVEPQVGKENMCVWQNAAVDPYFVVGTHPGKCSTHESGQSIICDRFLISVKTCDTDDYLRF